MKATKSLTAIALVALSCSSVAAYAQLMPAPIAPAPIAPAPIAPATTSPTTTTTTTTTSVTSAPTRTAVAPAPVAPPVTDFAARPGEGYEHANAHGKAHIAEHFSMSGTVSGDTLTVTSISGGRISIGQKLSGQGLPDDGIVITEFGTGTGGAGTYKFKAQ